MRGLLIVLEGIDGSGTTTQSQLLTQYYSKKGRKVHPTCEPSKGPIGQLIRKILEKRISPEDKERKFDASTMALLFAADRVDHIKSEIEIALATGAIVICDRYLLSSLIYQSVTADPDSLPSQQDWLRLINQGAREPDLTIVLDIKAEVAASRRSSRGEAEELYERDELQKKLAVLYQQADQLLPEQKVILVQADKPIEQVTETIIQAIDQLLKP